MKTHFHFCVLFLIAPGLSVFAQNRVLTKKLEATFSAGVVEENLTWSIAGNANGTNPNIYSELIWKDVHATRLDFQVKYNFWKAFVFDTKVNTGIIFDGSATDSDYEEDNRTSRVFFAAPRSDKGRLFSVDPSLGYRFIIAKRFFITPEVGYGVGTQKLFLLDDSGLHSTYQTLWQGIFLRAQNELFLSEKFRSHIDATYHQVNYHAKANWNLIETFQHPLSFEHMAKGYGIEAEIGLAYQLTKVWAISISGEFFKWTTGFGIDTLYLKNGTQTKTRLNDVTRDGYAIKIGISYSIPSHQPHIGLQ
jgi:hypothetical protein